MSAHIKELPSKIRKNLKELPNKIEEWPGKEWEKIKKNPVPYGSLAIAVVGLGIVEWPYSHSFLNGLDHIASGLLAIPTWEIPTQQGLTEMLRSPEGTREVAKWLAIDGGLVFLGHYIEKGIQAAKELFKGKKEERMLAGIEPINKEEKPSHILIGPSGMISDLAEIRKKENKEKNNNPIIGIHIDEEIPPVWGQEMKYHFKLNNPNQLIGRFPPSIKEMSFIEATGLDRAKEITFVCINPDNALFYGSEAQSGIPPTFVSTLLRKIPADQLKGKKINVIYNEETELGGTSKIAQELKGLADKLNFDPNLITPEQLFVDEVTADLEKIAATEKENEPINITLVGQGKTAIDEDMLHNFKEALGKIKLQNKVKINVSLLKRKYQSRDFAVETGEKGANITEETMESSVTDLLSKTDYVLAYGDHDHGTSSLVRLLLFAYKVPKEKINAVVERLSNEFDFKDEANPIVIYNRIINKMGNIVS